MPNEAVGNSSDIAGQIRHEQEHRAQHKSALELALQVMQDADVLLFKLFLLNRCFSTCAFVGEHECV